MSVIQSKPHICEILNVEVDEQFVIEGQDGTWTINSMGELVGSEKPKKEYVSNTIAWMCGLINDPSKITLVSPFTEEEADFARALQNASDAPLRVFRDKNGDLVWGYASSLSMSMSHRLPSGMFPSLKPGRGALLSDIIHDDETESETKAG